MSERAVTIYALVDPRDDAVRYVGKSVNLMLPTALAVGSIRTLFSKWIGRTCYGSPMRFSGNLCGRVANNGIATGGDRVALSALRDAAGETGGE